MKSVALYIGDSTGLKILKDYIKRKFNISYVVSTEKKINYLVNKICIQEKIDFLYSGDLKSSKLKKYNKKEITIISIFSRYIFSNKFIDNFTGKIFNIHPGLLPFYPGTNSVSGTLYNKESYTGVSIHLITKKIDSGEIILKKKIKIKKNDLAINVWNDIQKITIKLAEVLYRKLLKNNIVLQKNQVDKYRKKFPKFIPNKGLILPNIDSIGKVMNLYRASYYFPFVSSWGNLNFIYKNKKKLITNILILKKSDKLFKTVKKLNNKTYLIRLKNNKIIKVQTN